MDILLITPSNPYNSRSGGNQRTSLVLQALEKIGNVDTLYIRPGDKTEVSREELYCKGSWKEYPAGLLKFTPSNHLTGLVENCLKKRLGDYDVIVSRYLNPICKLKIPATVKTIVDLDDFAYQHSAGEGLKGILGNFKSKIAYALSNRQLKRFSSFFFVSHDIRKICSAHSGEVLPNIPYNQNNNDVSKKLGEDILFVGALWYQPNAYGVERFLKNSWPYILNKIPDQQINLIGEVPEDFKKKWSGKKGVNIKGFVDSLSDEYEKSALCIAPIYFGGGTNIKVLEALAYSRPCVGTPNAFNGFDPALKESDALLEAQTDEEFAGSCLQVLSNKKVYQQNIEKVKAVLSEKYSQKAFTQTVQKLVTETVE
jgi:glycosyltransferase involved in cell wall biosynthesis